MGGKTEIIKYQEEFKLLIRKRAYKHLFQRDYTEENYNSLQQHEKSSVETREKIECADIYD